MNTKKFELTLEQTALLVDLVARQIAWLQDNERSAAKPREILTILLSQEFSRLE